jgi:diamine N-acetyltransferase
MERWIEATRHEDAFDEPRSVADGGIVSLREVTADTVRAICRLTVRPDQQEFVAPNAISIAQAHFTPSAWFRAIYADETPVGFVMLERSNETHEYGLWRYMIAAGHQGKGYGRRGLELVIEDIRAADPDATELTTSWYPAPGGPEPFYLGFGFVPTGEIDDEEIVGRLDLTGLAPR